MTRILIAEDEPAIADNIMYALRTERYSLLVDLYADEAWLYDRKLDPGEQWDVATEHPDVVRELRARLDRHLEEMAAHGGIAPELRPVDDARLEELKALGYTR